jgi:hypothetical protein
VPYRYKHEETDPTGAGIPCTTHTKKFVHRLGRYWWVYIPA